MAFSQSFEMGNSTLLNLDSQARRAINRPAVSGAGECQSSNQNTDRGADGGIDVIEESPTQERTRGFGGMSIFSKTRSHRLPGNSSNACGATDKQRRLFRRSKSDSTLPKPRVVAEDNYTELFRSDFEFSAAMEDERKQEENSAVLRVSQIAAALETEVDEPQTVETDSADLDKPIFSEDLKDIMDIEKHLTDKIETDSWQDSLPLSAISHAVMNGINRVEVTVEDAPALDATSFICPALNDEAAEQLVKVMQQSRAEVQRECAASEQNNRCISMNESIKTQTQRDLDAKSSIMPKANVAAQSTQCNPLNRTTLSTDLESLKRVSAWNLPHSVLQEYEKKGVVKMFDWQIQCLSNPKVLFEHCNLVYSAPTSAGKSLVSEILLLKTVLERGKKVLLILPFISVVREKMFYLQDLLTTAGYRVEGFFGGYTPPGGFDSINVAICTIEKANSIVNRLLEQGKLGDIGTVVVDEVHLISDPGRGYILELLLAKVLYMSRKYGLQIQVITMSATLANVELLKRWLDAELFITDFRPVALQEMIKVGTKIYDVNMRLLRDVTQPAAGEVQPFPVLANDSDHVAQLCMETLLEGCSVIVFCPSKDWCENLAVQLAGAIHCVGKAGDSWGKRLRAHINREAINEVKRQLRDIPTGLDTVLEKTITYACAFHHAGLTSEERDIVEASFKSGALKIIVATSTLSSGVNLPARRVLIRTPLFGGKQMSSLTYRQMIGRAGRTGKDTLGESILICADSNARIGRDLVTVDLQPISSCLEMDSSTHLKRALLEVISSGVASTRDDIENFVNCTLLSAQKQLSEQGKDNSNNDQLYITDALDFLKEYEFVRLQTNEETKEELYVATRLGMACLAASMPPADGLVLFSELQRSRRCFVLESELHAVYLVTPYSVCYQLQDLDWLLFLDLWEKLTPAMKRVGELVGVKESFLVRAMRGQTKLDYKLIQIHKRFYTALALQELVNETSINAVASKYKCSRGMLQGLQQMASTFAGIVTAFCNSLQWPTLSLVVAQFKERLYFGIHRDLIDLMRLPELSHKRARSLFDAGITSLVELANTDVFEVEKVLYNALSFDTAKQGEHENAYEAEQRNSERNYFITGKAGLSAAEAAKLLVQEARKFVQYEIGVGAIKWTQTTVSENSKVHMSFEGSEEKNKRKRKSKDKVNGSAGESSPPKVQKVEQEEQKPCTSKEAMKVLRQRNVMEVIPVEHSVQNKTKINHRDKNNAAAKLVGKNDTKIVQPTMEDNAKSKVQPKDMLKDLKRNTSRMDIVSMKQEEVFKGAAPSEYNIKNNKTSKDDSNKENSKVNTELVKHADKGAENSKRYPQRCSPKASAPNTPLPSKAATKNQATYPHENQITPKTLQHPISPAKVLPKPRRSPRNHKAPNIHPQYTPQHLESHSAKSNLQNAPQHLESHSAKSNLQNDPRHSESHAAKSNLQNAPQHSESHAAKSDVNISNCMDDLMLDESFELNTGINAALNAADKIYDDVAELSQETAKIALNKSSDEVPNSQEHYVGSASCIKTTQAARLLRSACKPAARSANGTTQQILAPATSLASGSIEVSDISVENSLIKDPIKLNTSHILSCSKVDTDASSFNCLQVVDICGDQNLFKAAFKELMTVKRFGFCLGLQQQASKRKPLIGANLLINQVHSREQPEASLQSVQFQIDDTTYVAGCAFCIGENIVYFMNMQDEGTCKGLSAEIKCKYLRMLLREQSHTLLVFDAKEQLKILRRAMPALEEIRVSLEDPQVGNWLLQPEKSMNFQQMTQQFAPECTGIVQLCGSGRGYSSFGLDAASSIFAKVRCAVEACATVHVLKGIIENLERIGTGQLYKFFKELEMPLQLSLCAMEVFGFPANESALRKLFQQMVETTKKLEHKIYELHGARFNLSSSAAVAKVLGLHRKSSGRVCTSRQILEKIDSPISQLIIAYRKVSSTLSKNIQPLLKCVQRDRIHGQSITFTVTGRISMTEPNLQNVAKDFDVQFGGADQVTISCRSAFHPNDSSRCLLSADFCQLEMRILAHLSQDAALLQVMNTEKDIFIAIAARWNKISESDVSEQLRNGTKQICYGIVYGMGMRSLAEALKCTEQEANMLSEQFHAAYPGIRHYAEKVVKFARNNGYIETITGRRRYLEHISSSEMHLKSQAERQAINSTIQGSAADIAKSAILRMEKNIEKYRNKLGITEHAVRLVLHVHDELVFELPEDKARKVAKVLSVTMENCVKLSVPLRVKLKVGKSWGELKEIKL